MIKKLTLTATLVAAITLALVLPALALRSTAAEPYGWDLQLRNTKTAKYSADMTYKAFRAWATAKHRQVTIVDDNGTSTVATDDVSYKGVALKTLVGYFDDKDPNTFNKALAAKGYSVVFLGMDGYSATISSKQIASLGSKVIIADLANDAPLAVPAATLDDAGLPIWVPDWPLRVVSSDPSITDLMAVQGVVRVSIVRTVAPTAAATEPYGWDLQLRNAVTAKYGADLTYKAFRKWAAVTPRAVSIVDTSTATPVTYTGVSLQTMVGYFDDNNRNTFSAALAVTGYNVVIVGMDGFTATIPSAQIASLGDKIILADLADGAPLAVPKAALDKNKKPSWKPSWPLKIVSLDPSVTGKMKPAGVVRISIVPAVAPAGAGRAPF